MIDRPTLPHCPTKTLTQLTQLCVVVGRYDVSQYQNCGTSTLSAHVYSEDGKMWHMLEPNVEPYTHTVHYEDGTEYAPLRATALNSLPHFRIYIATGGVLSYEHS